MANYERISEMLEDELDKIASSGKLTTSSLDVGDKAAHFLKSVKTIEAMENADDGYAYDSYSMRGMRGNSYARGRGSNAKRDSMGRYSTRYNDGYMGYSQESKEDLMKEIQMLKDKIQKMED